MDKLIKVVDSCTTLQQLANACRYAKLWLAKNPGCDFMVYALLLEKRIFIIEKIVI